MSKLPSKAGELAIDFMDKFHLEKSIHCTDEYIGNLQKARRNLNANSACCFCGFPDQYFLELHHINSHTDYSPENVRLICTLCHRLHHLGWVGVANLGQVIYFPSVINHKDKRFWLEPFQHIQRFYLMQDFLSAEQRERLKNTLLSLNMSQLINSLKTQDLDARFVDQNSERQAHLLDLKRLEQTASTDKQQVLDEIKIGREERHAKLADVQAGSDFADVHILDLLTLLMETGKKNDFLKEQNEGLNGRMSILFNPSVFKPFEPNPTYKLEDRLNYYNKLNYFSAQGLQQVMHTLRTQKQGTR